MNTVEALELILEQERLYALFQPIVGCRRQAVYGYEALIRGPSDSLLHSPLKLFDAAARNGRLVELDLLCRKVAIARFGELALPGRLFLNVTPQTVMEADFRSGETSRFLAEHGLSGNRVVIELTEQFPIHDYDVMRAAVQHYRAMGFSIAMDDLGAGYSGLRQWSELRPDYVKIDRHFVQGVDQDSGKRDFVRSIMEMARSLGCQVVAEGIETLEEYRTLWSSGLELGQGYYFARPAAQPARKVSTVLPAQRQEQRAKVGPANVGELARPVPPVNGRAPAEQVAHLFENDPSLRSVPVLDGEQRALGLARRADVLNLFASRYGRALYSRRPIVDLIQTEALRIPQGLALEALSQRITDMQGLAGDEDFIIIDRDDRYLGLGTIIDLLRAITEQQLRSARYANPLTGLPGNVPINTHIQQLLDQQRPFIVAYCDMDNFKAFNDRYGYAQGDDLILALSRLLQESLQPGLDFLGHIGGDDFMLVMKSADWHNRLREVLRRFETLAPWHYSETDRQAQGIRCRDRQDRPCFHPIVSLSVAVAPVPAGRFANPYDIASVMGELKAQAKARPGNSLFVDRRAYEEQDAAYPRPPRQRQAC
ncbi:bifunctional diguanylate cyclase/phosphodiesterase [Alkalilimnicola sp. S0819]|uniref:bifunctional diguanylate cyclase/phosphodiesterase n=1 Tax=Alkalilimnicola sp. S0819 TaxID=2613922 RepID=UPI0012622C5E|nr:bifunctional diguanylate cyclase/phosphodiesterase [Alkalilimnicola sp. S0819]KAB7627607.1 GGDEF domain-containing protein [Alkalilimnicola sp. S0819]MPQ15769.1 EAL domain-containing protein [Alkalilimnicola sp. S0819]